MAVIRGELREIAAFGPIFSNQVRSMVWVATDWPRRRLILGASRWIMGGKNPNMLEKWWG